MAVRCRTHQTSSALPLSPTSGSAADWDARYRAKDSVWALTPNEFVVRELGELKPAAVVDLAGGEGRHALWFASRGIRAENVEFSAVALEKFQARAKEQGLEHLVVGNHADARSARFQLATELVIVCYLQLPWDDLETSLDNALAQLPSGELFGVWHSLRNLTEGYGGPQYPAHLPTPDQLRDWLSARALHGKVWEEERQVMVDGEEYRAIDVLLRVKV